MQKISTKKLLAKTYKTIGFGGRWRASFGEVEVKSRWLIYGDSGNGKTELCVQLVAELCRLKFSVLYVSAEQSDRSSIQGPWRRNIDPLMKATLVKNATIEDIKKEIAKRGKKKAVIIDSVDYLDMTEEQYKELDGCEVTLIFVSWADGRYPKTSVAKSIRYMVDVKVWVDRFLARPVSRYGGNEPFVIYEERAKKIHAELNI